MGKHGSASAAHVSAAAESSASPAPVAYGRCVTLVEDAEALRLAGRWDEAVELLEGAPASGPVLVELARTLNDRSTFGGSL